MRMRRVSSSVFTPWWHVPQVSTLISAPCASWHAVQVFMPGACWKRDAYGLPAYS
jgi:hypothetical protein